MKILMSQPQIQINNIKNQEFIKELTFPNLRFI